MVRYASFLYIRYVFTMIKILVSHPLMRGFRGGSGIVQPVG